MKEQCRRRGNVERGEFGYNREVSSVYLLVRLIFLGVRRYPVGEIV